MMMNENNDDIGIVSWVLYNIYPLDINTPVLIARDLECVTEKNINGQRKINEENREERYKRKQN